MKKNNQIEITSKNNTVFKELKEISKAKDKYIFIEGKKLLTEALNSHINIQKIFLDRNYDHVFSALVSDNKKIDFIYIKNNLISSLYTTDSKPESNDLVIAIAEKPEYSQEKLFNLRGNIILLEDIQDPGNLGTIIRSALAFDVSGLILTKYSVDPFNTKVIRASAGAVFKLPIVKVQDTKEFLNYAKKKKYKVFATSPRKDQTLFKLNCDSRMVLIFGNEGKGLSASLLETACDVISIPISTKVESLNLASAVSIVLWELYKKKN